MPAEWLQHEGTWLQWPHEDSDRSAQRKLEGTWLAMVEGLCPHERVHITVQDERRRDHVEHQLDYFSINHNVDLHIIPTNDLWARDNGPIFVTDGNGRLAITDWNFNGWGERFQHELDKLVPATISDHFDIPRFQPPLTTEGGAIEVNGRGTLMATRSSIINDNRNPGRSQSEIEEILGRYLGVSHFIWLSGAPPEVCEASGDTTDYHIDIAARFVDEAAVLYAWTDNESDPRFPHLRKHYEELEAATTESGKPLTLVALPMPTSFIYATSRSAWDYNPSGFTDAAYTNYLVANGVVLVPVFGNTNDENAKSIIGEHFPGRDVIGIPCLSLTEDGGAIHCVTQQQPAV